jgi:hypothetical protein
MKICALLIAAAGVLAAQASSPVSDRELHWRQDFQAMSVGLKASGYRIAGGIATKGQKDFALLYPHFDQEIASLTADLPQLTDPEVLLRLMGLIASAHVAHNRIQTPQGMGFLNRLPVRFRWFADGIGVVAATANYPEALGTRVVSIGDLKPDRIVAAVEPYISYENQTELHQDAMDLITARGVLDHLHLMEADGKVVLHLQKVSGEPLTLPVTMAAPAVPRISAADGLHLPIPRYRSHPNTFYWRQYL